MGVYYSHDIYPCNKSDIGVHRRVEQVHILIRRRCRTRKRIRFCMTHSFGNKSTRRRYSTGGGGEAKFFKEMMAGAGRLDKLQKFKISTKSLDPMRERYEVWSIKMCFSCSLLPQTALQKLGESVTSS